MKDRYEIRVALVGDGLTEELTETCARDIENFGEAHWSEVGFVRAQPFTHSGYRNFETFCVANYVSGNYTGEATYAGFRALAKLHAGDRELAAACRELVERRAPTGDASVFADLLAGALEEVDWEGIARHVRAE